MTPGTKNMLTATTEINAPIEKIWELWTGPEHIMQWNRLSDDWHNTRIENDLHEGGRFLFAMGLKDGSFSFDFCGAYTTIKTNELIACTLDDSRISTITFKGDNPVLLTEDFEANTTDPLDIQQSFCQAVLNRFKRYVEEAV